jgi:hypothetical protein
VLLILAITHSGPALAMENSAAFAALLGLLGYE